MMERWIESAARRHGAYGGEFLQQGFAYVQSREMKVEGSNWASS
jgi:hypothetical protein